jgi:Fe/S biogenesis protein NfuA
VAVPPTIGSPSRVQRLAPAPELPICFQAQRLLQVLNEQVNRAIAAHGGRRLHLSGGCQGCGLAAATLRQGIEAMTFEAVSEITEVVDVTDRASGTNPYYKAD